MSELTGFEIMANRILYLIGWLIERLARIIGIGQHTANVDIEGFNSPLIYLTFGIFFAFACLHIFKRFLRKG